MEDELLKKVNENSKKLSYLIEGFSSILISSSSIDCQNAGLKAKVALHDIQMNSEQLN